ncbi:dehydrogenase [Streptomyces sp. NPDC001315]|uniref:dehydrogenase n=1 Tax=Streptomyces sp. NPDC001315 TaxID=3364562 RepID=UPI0036A882A8
MNQEPQGARATTPGGPDDPLGVWTGTVSHDDQADAFTISFTADRVVTSTTKVSSGRGVWSPADDGFRYTLREEFAPGAGLPGYVEISIDARRSGEKYTGTGRATVHALDGTEIHSTSATVDGSMLSAVGVDLLREGAPSANAG